MDYKIIGTILRAPKSFHRVFRKSSGDELGELAHVGDQIDWTKH